MLPPNPGVVPTSWSCQVRICRMRLFASAPAKNSLLSFSVYCARVMAAAAGSDFFHSSRFHHSWENSHASHTAPVVSIPCTGCSV